MLQVPIRSARGSRNIAVADVTKAISVTENDEFPGISGRRSAGRLVISGGIIQEDPHLIGNPAMVNARKNEICFCERCLLTVASLEWHI